MGSGEYYEFQRIYRRQIFNIGPLKRYIKIQKAKMLIFNQRHTFCELWRLRKSIYNSIFHFKKILNFLIIRLNILLKRTVITGVPVFLMIEPSSICNFCCPMCPRQHIPIKREKELLNLNLFRRLLEEMGEKLMFLSLWNYGEPFLNPDLINMIKLAKEYHIIVGMSTNGSLLNEDTIYKLLESNIDYLIFSIDGAYKSTYEQYRKGGDFIKVINNISKLLEQRIKLKSLTPVINLQCLLLRDTVREMEFFIKLGEEIGADKVSFKKLHFQHLIEKKLLPDEEIFLRKKVDTNFCSRPSLGAVVLSDGNVLPCCNDLSSKYIMGNIENDSFLSIWNNKYFVSFRENVLRKFNTIDICSVCYSNNFNESFYSVRKI